MTKKATPATEAQTAIQAYIRAKSRSVTLADISELMESYGITKADFQENPGYAWQRLAMALAHEAGKFKYAYGPPPPQRFSKDAAIRDAALFLLTKRLGNASAAARKIAKHSGQSVEYLRQRASVLKREGLSIHARQCVPMIEEVWDLNDETEKNV